MSIIHISYGNHLFKNMMRINAKAALYHGCDVSTIWNYDQLDVNFKKKFDHILKEERGCGLWCWKSYIIDQTMVKANPKDIIIYSDAGATIISSILPLVNELSSSGANLMPFLLNHTDRYYTKRLLLEEMGCLNPKFTDTLSRLATFVVMKNNQFCRRFVKEWMSLSQRKELIDNSKGQECDGFIEHRHDQAIYSMLTKKHNLPTFPDPSQWGEGTERKYPTIFDHHRHRDYDVSPSTSHFIDASFENDKAFRNFLTNQGYDQRDDLGNYTYYCYDPQVRKNLLNQLRHDYPNLTFYMTEDLSINFTTWFQRTFKVQDYIVLRVTNNEWGSKVLEEMIKTNLISLVDELYTDSKDPQLDSKVKKVRRLG